MTKLEQLLADLCPNGVEYKTVQAAVGVNRGKRLTKSQLSEDGEYEVYHGSKDSILGKYNQYNAPANTTIVVNTGGIGGVKFLDKPFWCSDGSFWLGQSDSIDSKFLYYCLSGYEDYFYSQKRVGGVPTIDRSVVEDFKIPIPPLPVQSEIVRILDNFTELTTELAAELTARKQQYEYYKDSLFNVFSQSQIPVKNVPLAELCSIKGRIGFRGYTTKDMVGKGKGAISLSPGNIKNHTLFPESCTYITWDKYFESPEIMVELGDILLCKTGSTVGKVCIVEFLPEKATINPQLVVLKNVQCNPKYLKYYMTTEPFQREIQKRKGIGSVPNISQKEIGNINIPVPSIAEQERVVSILDQFDCLCNDISAGLPAEIEARQKQYEYYRDKLLTFTPAE